MSNLIFLQSPPPKLVEVQKTIFSQGAVDFVTKLHEEFDSDIEQLYKDRFETNAALQTNLLDFMISPQRSDKSWKVADIPSRLRNRRLDLGDVSPSNRAHFIDALRSDVQGIQVDFDDGHCPTWSNQLHAYNNINLFVNGKLPGAPPSITTTPVLIFRPRAWNMIEHDILINGKEAIGPLVDFGILMYHNAQKLWKANSGPYFYLSKLEGATEAKLWNDIFVWAQNELGLPQGTIRACVLIENIISIFELDEILYALKDHAYGLNCGIWDYCASIISKFGDRMEFLLPDRNKYVDIDRHFLNSYMKLVVRTCRERGAIATGGMAASTLTPGADDAGERSIILITRLLEAKLKELDIGVEGFIIYDKRLVGYVNEMWKKNGSANYLIQAELDVVISAEDVLAIPQGGVTSLGVKQNVAVTILFMYHWLAGVGHFFYRGNVEDSATAEISRWQIWQWIRFATPLEDDLENVVTPLYVEKVASEFATYAHKNLCRSAAERKRLTSAKYMSLELFYTRNPPQYITSYLNDNHKFRTLHNKALISNL